MRSLSCERGNADNGPRQRYLSDMNPLALWPKVIQSKERDEETVLFIVFRKVLV